MLRKACPMIRIEQAVVTSFDRNGYTQAALRALC